LQNDFCSKKINRFIGGVQMKISKMLINYIADGDNHAVLSSVSHSTNLREIVTVGYMVENPVQDEEIGKKEKAVS
jgi:hypothetical protein